MLTVYNTQIKNGRCQNGVFDEWVPVINYINQGATRTDDTKNLLTLC